MGGARQPRPIGVLRDGVFARDPGYSFPRRSTAPQHQTNLTISIIVRGAAVVADCLYSFVR